jgi:hypothetical protein
LVPFLPVLAEAVWKRLADFRWQRSLRELPAEIVSQIINRVCCMTEYVSLLVTERCFYQGPNKGLIKAVTRSG